MAERTFRMVLPKYDNSGQRISTDVLRDFAREVARRFGGVSVVPQQLGCYVGQDGRLQCEENVVLEVTRTGATPEQLEQDRRWFMDLARQAGRKLGQEAVFVQEETDTVTTFLPGQRRQRVGPELIETDFFKKLID